MEQALRIAFEEVLPGVRIKYCNFHVAQAVMKRWISPAINLRALLSEDEDLSRWVKSFPGLSYLPPNLVKRGFQALGRWILAYRDQHPATIPQDIFERISGKYLSSTSLELFFTSLFTL